MRGLLLLLVLFLFTVASIAHENVGRCKVRGLSRGYYNATAILQDKQNVIAGVPSCTRNCQSLRGKRAVIFGGGNPRSQGYALAKALSDEGVDVIVATLRPGCYPTPTGWRVYPFSMDYRNFSSIDAFYRWLPFDDFDFLFDVVGISALGNVTDFSGPDIARLLQINVLGGIHAIYVALNGLPDGSVGPKMDPCDIVMSWGSNAGEYESAPYLTPYVMAKMAKRGYNFEYNVENMYSGFTHPIHILLEPNGVNTSFGDYDWIKPDNVPESYIAGIQSVLADFLFQSGMPASVVAQQVIQIVKTPIEDLKTRYLIYNPPSSGATDPSIVAKYNLPVDQSVAYLSTTYAPLVSASHTVEPPIYPPIPCPNLVER